MDFRKFSTYQPWALLLLFLALWWALPTLVKSFSALSFYECQAPVWNFQNKVKDLQSYWAERNHSKHKLIELNRDLARLNASYELVIAENEALKEELKRLEKLFELPHYPEYKTIVARVCRRSIKNWTHQIVIEKGKKDGVVQGAAVINKTGTVGRVKKTYLHSSVIELVSSPTFRMTVAIKGDLRPITYQGNAHMPFSNLCGQCYNIPLDIQMLNDSKKSLELVSSKMGGVFPDGLPVGKLKSLQLSTDGLFQTAQVELSETLQSIREVAILLPLSSQYEI